jgi:aspartyl-tRNA(Asn)/glutamyl-tRNA(Gln) amidotransferase subunit C
MSLNANDITRIAQLARLQPDAPARARLLEQLNAFFAVVEQMRAVPTDGVEPLAHPVAATMDVTLRLHDDQVTEVDQREANQCSAPAVEQGLFLVPRVIE